MPKPPLPRIHLKRVYDAPSPDDGLRLLVERLWPRGLTRDKAGIDCWFKVLAPSTELRRWYNHIPDRWPEFRDRYLDELNTDRSEEVGELISLCLKHPVTFIFAARNSTHNSAVVLREHVLEIIGTA